MRHQCPRIFQVRFELVVIRQRILHARLEAPLHDLDHRRLLFHVLAGQVEAFLQRAVFHVIGGHVAQEHDQDEVVVLDRGVEAGVGGFDGTAELAPEIQLPCQVEGGGVTIEEPFGSEPGAG